MDLSSANQEWVQVGSSGLPGNVCQNLPGFGGVWARCSDCRYRFADFAGADSLQGTRHLRYVFYAADAHPHFAG
jgi:hypothetical protein